MSFDSDTLTRMHLANPATQIEPEELAALWSMIDEELATHSTQLRVPRQKRSPALRSPRPAIVIAVALVVTLAVFLPFVLLGGGVEQTTDDPPATTIPPPTTAAPTTTAPPTTTTAPTIVAPPTPLALSTDPRELRWRRVDMPGLSGGYLWFRSVIAGGPGLIAVGSASDWRDPFIWTSPDGVEWSPATGEMTGNQGWAFDVTAGGPGYIAVGWGVWTSTDGTEWAMTEQRPYGELRAVTIGGPGFVAVGTDDDRAAAWTSVDGTQWSRVEHDEGIFGSTDTAMVDVVAGGPGLVAVGNFGGVGAIWTSPDGVEWSRVPHDSEVFGHDTEGIELHSIAAHGSGFIAVGGVTHDGTRGVWRSSDGLDWSVVSLDPSVFNGGPELMSVVSTEQGFIAAGANDVGVWFSPNGITWTRLQSAGALGTTENQGISDITVFGDSVVAVGWDVDSELVWIGEPVQE